MDKVCYIEFLDNDGTPTANVYFAGRRHPLSIESENMEDLIAYFHGNTIEKENPNDSPKTGSSQG